LALAWAPNQSASGYQDYVSYTEVPTGTTVTLYRNFCNSGPSGSPTSRSLLSYDIPPGQSSPTITPALKNAAAQAGWTSVIGITGITFSIAEPQSAYTYSLTAQPRGSTSSSTLTQVGQPNTTCGFAVPGSGTYAATLCFVDFSSYNFLSSSGPCQPVIAAVTNTPYTLSACVKTTTTASAGAKGYECNVSSAPYVPATVVPCPLPTYFSPPTSEAFLGNNGFYSGVPGNAALYTNAEGSSASVQLTNIQLLDSNGNPASNWQLVTGDAESTDGSESMTWTSDELFTLLPDSAGSPIGNACQLSGEIVPNSGLTPRSLLAGGASATVVCQATVSNDKTGTVMLAAPSPTQFSVNMVGTGLQAVFVGVLLPS
jgi:Surface adhesin CshA non-repetitive domain 2